MDLKELFSGLNVKINNFFSFVVSKLKDFRNLSLGEQIAYCSTGTGVIFIVIAIILFLV